MKRALCLQIWSPAKMTVESGPHTLLTFDNAASKKMRPPMLKVDWSTAKKKTNPALVVHVGRIYYIWQNKAHCCPFTKCCSAIQMKSNSCISKSEKEIATVMHAGQNTLVKRNFFFTGWKSTITPQLLSILGNGSKEKYRTPPWKVDSHLSRLDWLEVETAPQRQSATRFAQDCCRFLDKKAMRSHSKILGLRHAAGFYFISAGPHIADKLPPYCK